MVALNAFETVLPFDFSEIFPAIQVRFEPIGELLKVLTLENIHITPIFIRFKVMYLSTDLYKLITKTVLSKESKNLGLFRDLMKNLTLFLNNQFSLN